MESAYLIMYEENGKNNNFNLIRFVAAMLVLYSHSFALATGSEHAEPFRSVIGMTPGTIAVDIFFITSGFLVTRSLITRNNIFDFMSARVLRIYPALLFSVAITVLLIGYYFNSDNFYSYIVSPGTMAFVRDNSISLFNTAFTLPNVFVNNPYKNAVNGSLWTLPYELKMYGSLVILWVVLLLATRSVAKYYKYLVVFVVCAAAVVYFRQCGIRFVEQSIFRLMLMFYVGALYYMFRAVVCLKYAFFIIGAAALIISYFIQKDLFFVIYLATMPYIVLFLAYVPGGLLRSFNKFGDYSYGLYIYAFPVQQTVASLINPISPIDMFALSSLFTFFIAFFSWHIIEKNALKLKGKLSFARALAFK